MPLRAWMSRSEVQPGAPGLSTLTVSSPEWLALAQDLAAAGARLLAIWADHDRLDAAVVRAAFLLESRGIIVRLPLPDRDTRYPGLEELFPSAARMQRALADLSGIQCTAPDRRSWLRHAAWPRDYAPLRSVADPPDTANDADPYEFVRVDGDGVHEIAVGPVHAGTIEPGHFRFSVVGEKVLRLEERLGYVHKGIERRFRDLPLLEGHRLAARVSGDSAVAYSWAYCQALEGMTGTEVSSRANWLRALCLELERVANHLGDLGALGNDAGFAFGLAQFSRLKEELLRATQDALGARYLMNMVVPGGTRLDLPQTGSERLEECMRAVEREVATLRVIYEEHEGMRDRFSGAGCVAPELAARLGLTGLAGRASGQPFDLRIDMPCEPYSLVQAVKCTRTEGDVASRVAVRFDEVLASSHLIRRLLKEMPAGQHLAAVPVPPPSSTGAGVIEGWRGPVLLWLEAGETGAIHRCHPHDPSWQNWPVLEHAIIGNIVPDFPLINKSFNLSYSGHDL